MDPDDIIRQAKEEHDQIEFEEIDNQPKVKVQQQDFKSQDSNPHKVDIQEAKSVSEKDDNKQIRTRSGRVSQAVFKYVTHHTHLQTQSTNPKQHTLR